MATPLSSFLSLRPPAPSLRKFSTTVRAWVPSFPSRIYLPWLLLFLTVISPSPTSFALAEISYTNHCASIVPQAIPTGIFLGSNSSTLQLFNGYFSGGRKPLNPDPPSFSSPYSSIFSFPGSFSFYAHNHEQTLTPGVLHVEGSLDFRGRRRAPFSRSANNSSLVFHMVRELSFRMSGFWSESTGKLCLIGSAFQSYGRGTPLPHSAVLKLNYPKTSNISTSLVSGTIESLDSANSLNHLDPTSLLAYSNKNYNFTQVPQVTSSCTHVKAFPNKSLGLEVNSSCSYLQNLRGRFRLERGSDCLNKNSDPFFSGLGFSPSLMTFNQLQCSENGRVSMFIVFSNVSDYEPNHILVPENSLVGEGFWDWESKRLCLLACPILNTKDSLENASVGNCSIGFSLWFPSIFSIKQRSSVMGYIWSNKPKEESGHFRTVPFRSLESHNVIRPGLKYEYTQIDAATKSCMKYNQVPILGKKRYPDGSSLGDLGFGLSHSTENRSMWVDAIPVSLGERIYERSYMVAATMAPTTAPTLVKRKPRIWNVSYSISYTFNSYSDVNEPVRISAEGIYNSGIGMLCMVGCRYLNSLVLSKQIKTKDYMDCEILINIQLPALNPDAGEQHKGMIKSTRKKSDPLYFEPLEVLSYGIYTDQVVDLIQRMDIEVVMVLVSLTLSCVFIGLQIFHTKKLPDVRPSASIAMLVILTLGYMIPLVLNFEALISMNRKEQHMSLDGGRWLGRTEVIVRIMTLVAFLMQFRFLQLVWTARLLKEDKIGLWIAERKALMLCLPLYFAGALIVCIVNLSSYDNHLLRPGYTTAQNHSLWKDLMSYAGLILDGFLLPQIILNVFWSSKDKALAHLFYFGTTAVRALPHLYDAYRAHHNLPIFVNSSYIYANPNGDLYSSAWDIIIPLGGVLFAVIIYLQQKYGGRCFLPQRFRKPRGYQTVPTISL